MSYSILPPVEARKHQTARKRAGKGYLLMGGFAHVQKLDNVWPARVPSGGQPLLGAEGHLLQEGRGSELQGKTPARAAEMPFSRKAFLVQAPPMNNLCSLGQSWKPRKLPAEIFITSKLMI